MNIKVKFLFLQISVAALANVLNDNSHISKCIIDIAKGMPSGSINVVFDNYTDRNLINSLQFGLQNENIPTSLFNLTNSKNEESYLHYITENLSLYKKMHSVFFCSHQLSVKILLKFNTCKLIHRNVLNIFYWGKNPIKRHFVRSLHEAMSVIVITNPRVGVYRLFFNQGTAHRKHHLSLVNWWSHTSGLFHVPTLPLPTNTYKNFNNKVLRIPVIHKPPWHFVRIKNGSVNVYGGRDAKLLKLLSNKLNFRYKYLNPTENDLNILNNESFKSALDLIHKREADIFLGDVALTSDRNSLVDFTFFTLADSGAFITHAPSRLSETLALIRPFQKEVWPPIILTVVISGPILYILIAIPNSYRQMKNDKSNRNLLFSCVWFSLTIFLKQTAKAPVSSHKFRFFTMVLSICATYILTDMYSANLTSLLARPGREKPINNLFQLEEAMRLKKYELYIDQHNSLYSILQNGSGIYGKIWKLMLKQPKYISDSVESTVTLIKSSEKNILMAGRETLFFDIQRFGSTHFHLSEKLNTAYSAIAVQYGCPYIENVNKILMAIFETGILSKMTEDEYRDLDRQQTIEEESTDIENIELSNLSTGMSSTATKSKSSDKLEPINIQMLQGAFYILVFGHTISTLIFIIEMKFVNFKRGRKLNKIISNKYRRIKLYIHGKCNSISRYVIWKYRDIKHNLYMSTMEYLE